MIGIGKARCSSMLFANHADGRFWHILRYFTDLPDQARKTSFNYQFSVPHQGKRRDFDTSMNSCHALPCSCSLMTCTQASPYCSLLIRLCCFILNSVIASFPAATPSDWSKSFLRSSCIPQLVAIFAHFSAAILLDTPHPVVSTEQTAMVTRAIITRSNLM